MPWPRRLPKNNEIAKASIPEFMCTGLPPAKSNEPRSPNLFINPLVYSAILNILHCL